MPFPEATPRQLEAIPSFDGGVNSRLAVWNLEQQFAADMQDIDVSRVGRWSPRSGASPQGGRQDPPGGLGRFQKDDDDVYAWSVFGTRICRSTGNGTWDVKASNVSCRSDVLHMFVEGIYNYSAFVGNQYRALYGSQAMPSSGTTEATYLFVVKGDDVDTALQATQHSSYAPLCITYFQNRLWKANDQVDGDGNDLAWSELDDGLTYSPANALSIEPGIGGRITALIPGRATQPELYVFKQEAIALLEPRWGGSSALIPTLGDELDTVNSRVQLITRGVGCVATRSCMWVPGPQGDDVMFLARDGVRRLSRADNDQLSGAGPPLSYSIPSWIDRINWNYAHKAVAAFYDNAYHLAVPMDGAVDNNYVLRFDTLTQAWSLHSWQTRDLLDIPFNNEARLYFQNEFTTQDCSYTGAPASEYQVYRAYSGDADPGGSPVPYWIEPRAFMFGNPEVEKRWERLFLLGSCEPGVTHSMRIAYQVDFQGWQTAATLVEFGVPANTIILGETPLTWVVPDTKLIQRRIGLSDVGVGTMLQLRFMSAELDFAKPSIYFGDVKARHCTEIFDNER